VDALVAQMLMSPDAPALFITKANAALREKCMVRRCRLTVSKPANGFSA
jgi:hypothetical protein